MLTIGGIPYEEVPKPEPLVPSPNELGENKSCQNMVTSVSKSPLVIAMPYILGGIGSFGGLLIPVFEGHTKTAAAISLGTTGYMMGEAVNAKTDKDSGAYHTYAGMALGGGGIAVVAGFFGWTDWKQLAAAGAAGGIVVGPLIAPLLKPLDLFLQVAKVPLKAAGLPFEIKKCAESFSDNLSDILHCKEGKVDHGCECYASKYPGKMIGYRNPVTGVQSCTVYDCGIERAAYRNGTGSTMLPACADLPVIEAWERENPQACNCKTQARPMLIAGKVRCTPVRHPKMNPNYGFESDGSGRNFTCTKDQTSNAIKKWGNLLYNTPEDKRAEVLKTYFPYEPYAARVDQERKNHHKIIEATIVSMGPAIQKLHEITSSPAAKLTLDDKQAGQVRWNERKIHRADVTSKFSPSAANAAKWGVTSLCHSGLSPGDRVFPTQKWAESLCFSDAALENYRTGAWKPSGKDVPAFSVSPMPGNLKQKPLKAATAK